MSNAHRHISNLIYNARPAILLNLADGSANANCPNGGTFIVEQTSETSFEGEYTECDYGLGAVNGQITMAITEGSAGRVTYRVEFGVDIDGFDYAGESKAEIKSTNGFRFDVQELYAELMVGEQGPTPITTSGYRLTLEGDSFRHEPGDSIQFEYAEIRSVTLRNGNSIASAKFPLSPSGAFTLIGFANGGFLEYLNSTNIGPVDPSRAGTIEGVITITEEEFSARLREFGSSSQSTGDVTASSTWPAAVSAPVIDL